MARKEKQIKKSSTDSETREIQYPVPVFYNGTKVGEMNRQYVVKFTNSSITTEIIDKIQSEPLVIESTKTGDKVVINHADETEKRKMYQQRDTIKRKTKTTRWH